MNQPIKLQLNPEALVALFPEGGAARLELQNAVIAQFLRQHIKIAALGDGVKYQVEKAKKEAMLEAMKGVGFKTDVYGNVQPTEESRRTLAQEARRAVRDELADALNAAVAAHAASVQSSAREAVNLLVNVEIAAAVKARVQEVAKGVLGGS